MACQENSLTISPIWLWCLIVSALVLTAPYAAMGADVRDFYITAAKSAAYSILFVLPAAYIMYKLLMPDSWLYLIIDCLVVTGVMIAGLVGVILDESDRERVLGKMKKLLRRPKP